MRRFPSPVLRLVVAASLAAVIGAGMVMVAGGGASGAAVDGASIAPVGSATPAAGGGASVVAVVDGAVSPSAGNTGSVARIDGRLDATGDADVQAVGQRAAPALDELLESPATFSILGYDPETGEVGGAVQSRVFSVGNGVLWAEAGVGVVATQAIVDVSYGPQALELLKQDMAPAEIVRTIWQNDPDPQPDRWTKQGRQFAVMNAGGEYAAFTGPEANEWAGHRGGAWCTAQGNILAGPEVVDAMVEAFESTEGRLWFKLLAALEAGQAAGGDRRGMQSAAILIVEKGGGVWLNNDVVMRLQVDDHEQPIQELRRLVEIADRQQRGVERRRQQGRGGGSSRVGQR